MKILISNDDGVLAPGLAILANTLAQIGTIQVVVPDRDRSGASNSLTLKQPLRVNLMENGFYSVEGTPTDCVHLALMGLFDDQPDIVVSGINNGANLGDDVFYSGTVAAAMEGRNLGLPAIAISLVEGKPRHYATAAAVIQQLVLRLRDEVLPVNTILNVNVPDVSLTELAGFDVTRLGTRHSAERIVCQQDPRGHDIYWVGPSGAGQDAGPGTDFYAVATARVSITPLHLDLTHYQSFEPLSKWLTGLEIK